MKANIQFPNCKLGMYPFCGIGSANAQRRVKIFKRAITIVTHGAFIPIDIQRCLCLLSVADGQRNFCGPMRTASKFSRPTSTQFHVAAFRYCRVVTPSLVEYNFCHDDHEKFDLQHESRRVRIVLVSHAGPRASKGTLRCRTNRHGPSMLLHLWFPNVSPGLATCWPSTSSTSSQARPWTTKMRGGMIYNGVMGARDDTAVIVEPRGIIAMPDLGLSSRRMQPPEEMILWEKSTVITQDCVVEKYVEVESFVTKCE